MKTPLRIQAIFSLRSKAEELEIALGCNSYLQGACVGVVAFAKAFGCYIQSRPKGI